VLDHLDDLAPNCSALYQYHCKEISDAYHLDAGQRRQVRIPQPDSGRYNPAMDITKLSEAAVACLRFRIKGFSLRNQDLAAYRELVDAGIMAPESGMEYRFTPWGIEHREEILERESERINAERMAPPDGTLSHAARERLRRHLAGDNKVTEENHPAYRELVAARVMIHSHPFVGGDDYSLTYWGWKLKDELIARARESA